MNRPYDPLLYISSPEMPFTIRVEVTLKEEIDGEILFRAAQKAKERYPYFSLRALRDGEEIGTGYNPLPFAVYYDGETVLPLGGEEVNRHFFAFGYHGRQIDFYASHAVTDGAGLYPMIKTVLYFYLCEKLGRVLDPTGIDLPSSPVTPEETADPFPPSVFSDEPEPYLKKPRDYFRLPEGEGKGIGHGRVFRFRVGEAETMAFSRDHDGSPCALAAVLMNLAIRRVHPENEKSLVCAVSFNLRPGLGIGRNHRMLCSSVPLEYPDKTRKDDVLRLCTLSRGMLLLQTQPENARAFAREQAKIMRFSAALPTLGAKKKTLGALALDDSTANTYSVSYVGKMNYFALSEHIESVYNLTDGSVPHAAFLEISSCGGYFDIALLQGFEDDVYFRALLSLFRECGIEPEEGETTPLLTPKTILP